MSCHINIAEQVNIHDSLEYLLVLITLILLVLDFAKLTVRTDSRSKHADIDTSVLLNHKVYNFLAVFLNTSVASYVVHIKVAEVGMDRRNEVFESLLIPACDDHRTSATSINSS